LFIDYGSWAVNIVSSADGPGVLGAVMGVRRGEWGNRPRFTAGFPRLGMRIRRGWIVRSGCVETLPSGWGWSLLQRVCLWIIIGRRGSGVGIVRGGMRCWRRFGRPGCNM
jgi:hypothetical protein